MKLQGRLENIIVNPSGLECCIKIYFEKAIGSIWCYTLLDEELEQKNNHKKATLYKESADPVKIAIGDQMEFQTSIVFAGNYTYTLNEKSLGFVQTKGDSSHTEFNGIVKEIINEYAFICDIGVLGDNILVESIPKIKDTGISVNKQIQFNGEIKVEPA